MSKMLEMQAASAGQDTIVLGTFQHAIISLPVPGAAGLILRRKWPTPGYTEWAFSR